MCYVLHVQSHGPSIQPNLLKHMSEILTSLGEEALDTYSKHVSAKECYLYRIARLKTALCVRIIGRYWPMGHLRFGTKQVTMCRGLERSFAQGANIILIRRSARPSSLVVGLRHDSRCFTIIIFLLTPCDRSPYGNHYRYPALGR